MASMRTLRRRLLRWQRYDARAAKLIPVLVDRGLRRGHYRAAKAVDAENERRFWAETPEIWLGGPEGERALIADVLGMPCQDCGLPDLHRGQGDGIGSCDCPRCRDCGAAPGDCDGHDEFFCGDPDCSCGGPDDDAGHGDDWPPDVVTEHGFQEAGLL